MYVLCTGTSAASVAMPSSLAYHAVNNLLACLLVGTNLPFRVGPGRQPMAPYNGISSQSVDQVRVLL